MELSLRMRQVADMVEPCQTVADIGCDHGYVSIYLIEQGIAQQVIAMDVRKGPLSRAEENVVQKQLQNRIQCRLSDGLEQLKASEVDTIVIAGMGGPLMIDILNRGKEKCLRANTLILQPQSDIPKVRRYLHSIGFQITREEMLREDEKYYVIIQAKPGKEQYVNNMEYQYGRCLLQAKSPVLKQFLLQEARIYHQIAEGLKGKHTPKTEERLQEVEQQLQWNKEAQEQYEIERNNK